MPQTAISANHLYEILPDGRWKVKFDHHMISDFGTCEQLFSFKHVPHVSESNGQLTVLRAKGGYSWYATFGIWWAHVLEDFYVHVQHAQEDRGKAFEGGRSIQSPTEADLIRYAMRWWKADDMARFALIAPRQYEKFAMGYLGMDLDGRQVKFPVGAVQLAQQYYQYYDRMRDFDNWKVLAVESTFGTEGDVIIGESPLVVVAYQGRPDIVIYNNSKQWVEPVDTKTTSNIDVDFINSWKPNAQLQGYCVATQKLCDILKINATVDHVVINGAARDLPAEKPKDGIKKPRLDRFRISYTPSELAEWSDQMVLRAERLRQAIEGGRFIRRESACHNQYGHPCEYREICNKAPEDRLTIIQSHYQWQEPWSPKRA